MNNKRLARLSKELLECTIELEKLSRRQRVNESDEGYPSKEEFMRVPERTGPVLWHLIKVGSGPKGYEHIECGSKKSVLADLDMLSRRGAIDRETARIIDDETFIKLKNGSKMNESRLNENVDDSGKMIWQEAITDALHKLKSMGKARNIYSRQGDRQKHYSVDIYDPENKITPYLRKRGLGFERYYSRESIVVSFGEITNTNYQKFNSTAQTQTCAAFADVLKPFGIETDIAIFIGNEGMYENRINEDHDKDGVQDPDFGWSRYALGQNVVAGKVDPLSGYIHFNALKRSCDITNYDGDHFRVHFSDQPRNHGGEPFEIRTFKIESESEFDNLIFACKLYRDTGALAQFDAFNQVFFTIDDTRKFNDDF